jgi:hypothetical protein
VTPAEMTCAALAEIGQKAVPSDDDRWVYVPWSTDPRAVYKARRVIGAIPPDRTFPEWAADVCRNAAKHTTHARQVRAWFKRYGVAVW